MRLVLIKKSLRMQSKANKVIFHFAVFSLTSVCHMNENIYSLFIVVTVMTYVLKMPAHALEQYLLHIAIK